MKLFIRHSEPPTAVETDAADALARTLQAQVETAFAPDPAALARIRAKAITEFQRSTVVVARVAARPAVRRGWLALPRPWAASVFALGLMTGSTGLVGAYSGPAEPFYGLRLAAEELLLPSTGDARVRAEVARLDSRLTEARVAAQDGDPGATTAALNAYRSELSATVADIGVSGVDPGGVLVALAGHQSVLSGLAATAPAAALGGLHQAIDEASHAQDRLRSMPSGPPPAPGLTANPGGATPGSSTLPNPGQTVDPTPGASLPVLTPGRPSQEPPPAATPSLPAPATSHEPSHAPGRP